MTTTHDYSQPEYQAIWNTNAAFWDNTIGDTGNRFHRMIVEPAVLDLLDLQSGQTILEIACGNGAFARTMAKRGIHVIASDFSADLLRLAQERTTEYQDQIEYVLIDATQEEQIVALGERRFDSAVCNMGLMDMPQIAPLFSGLSRTLKRGGIFVFSIQHPCFNSNTAVKTVELHDNNGDVQTIHSIKVAEYLTPRVERCVGVVGQPEPHYIFHRPIHTVLDAGFRAGFVLDGFQEPKDPAVPNDTRWNAWSNYQEIPPALIGRFRLL